MRLPPFHSQGEDEGDFYTLAFVRGWYVPPSRQTKDDAFFLLSFSPSKGFTKFSVSTVSPDGHLFHYSRGTDELDTAEYTMLRAWREENVPLHAWRFFPSSAIDPTTFTNDAARTAFMAARLRVARIIFQARTHVWTRAQFPTEPLFRFSEADLPDLMASTPESDDLEKCIAENSKS